MDVLPLVVPVVKSGPEEQYAPEHVEFHTNLRTCQFGFWENVEAGWVVFCRLWR